MPASLTEVARDRLRAQIQRERQLAARVLETEARLSDAIAQRDAVLAADDRMIQACRADVADALIAYVRDAGVGLDRAAIILGRPKAELLRMINERRLATKAG